LARRAPRGRKTFHFLNFYSHSLFHFDSLPFCFFLLHFVFFIVADALRCKQHSAYPHIFLPPTLFFFTLRSPPCFILFRRSCIFTSHSLSSPRRLCFGHLFLMSNVVFVFVVRFPCLFPIPKNVSFYVLCRATCTSPSTY
jgi:hypothetical protein